MVYLSVYGSMKRRQCDDNEANANAEKDSSIKNEPIAIPTVREIAFGWDEINWKNLIKKIDRFIQSMKAYPIETTKRCI